MDDNSYQPLQNGIQKSFREQISYVEQKPTTGLQNIVSCYWSLATTNSLDRDFIYVVMPDACIDIVFDAKNATAPLIMTPHLNIEELNLGQAFHYIGIRLLPGSLAHSAIDPQAVVGKQQDVHQINNISLNQYDEQIRKTADAKEQFATLQQLATEMLTRNIVHENKLVANVITGMQFGLSQEAIAQKIGYSPRQLRRKIKEQTGFSPVQLQRVLRFQMALSPNDALLRFADQSHLIKEFRRFTGSTFSTFKRKF